MGFLSDLDVRLVGWRSGRSIWRLLAPLRYRRSSGAEVVVPAGFVTDLASVPRLPLAWWVAGGRAARPAVLHDWCYQHHELLLADGSRVPVSRSEADALFAEAIRTDPFAGAGPISAALMPLAVRVFGAWAWDRADERRESLLTGRAESP